MKKFFAIAALTLAASPVVIDPVFAAEKEEGTYCHSTGVADAGYNLEVAADGKTAVLFEESFAGQKKVADMTCSAGHIATHPDALNNYLNCRAHGSIDGGLMVRLYAGGIAGLHYASVRTFAVFRGKVLEQEVKFGRLNCSN